VLNREANAALAKRQTAHTGNPVKFVIEGCHSRNMISDLVLGSWRAASVFTKVVRWLIDLSPCHIMPTSEFNNFARPGSMSVGMAVACASGWFQVNEVQ
jgi:hypothetical protein